MSQEESILQLYKMRLRGHWEQRNTENVTGRIYHRGAIKAAVTFLRCIKQEMHRECSECQDLRDELEEVCGIINRTELRAALEYQAEQERKIRELEHEIIRLRRQTCNEHDFHVCCRKCGQKEKDYT